MCVGVRRLSVAAGGQREQRERGGASTGPAVWSLGDVLAAYLAASGESTRLIAAVMKPYEDLPALDKVAPRPTG